MLTRRDLNNLQHLLLLAWRKRYRAMCSLVRNTCCKIKAGTLFIKTEALTPSSFLPIIRSTFPTSLAGEIVSVLPPADIDKTLNIEQTSFDEIIIDGGSTHDFVRGFINRPWRLLHQTGYIEQYKNSVILFKNITSSSILEELRPSWRVDLPAKLRRKWELRIEKHRSTH